MTIKGNLGKIEIVHNRSEFDRHVESAMALLEEAGSSIHAKEASRSAAGEEAFEGSRSDEADPERASNSSAAGTEAFAEPLPS